MEFLDAITDHLAILIGVLLFFVFILAVLNLWGGAENTYGRVMSKIGFGERMVSKDNITVKLEYNEVVLDTPKVYENNILIETRQAHNFKFVLNAKSDNIFFEGKVKELTKPVMGSMKIPIYIDATTQVIKAQNVTVSVYLVEDDGDEKLIKELTFEVKPDIKLMFRMFPNKDTTIIGVFDTPVPDDTLDSMKKLATKLDDITALNGQILLYMESRLDDNLVVTIDMTVQSNYKSSDSFGKMHILYPDDWTISYELEPVSDTVQKLSTSNPIVFNRVGAFSIIVPELGLGVYTITLDIKVYYNRVSDDTFLTSGKLKFKVVSYPGEGFIITQAVSLTVPYSVQEHSSIWDLLWELTSPVGATIGLNDKEYHIIGFIDSGIAYTPMPDTTLTERTSGVRYNVDVGSKEVKLPGLPPKRVIVVKFQSRDGLLKGFTQFYKVQKDKTVDVYIFRYYLIDDELTNEAFSKRADNFDLFKKWLESLTKDLNDKDYFPLFYSQDALVVVSKFGGKIKDIEYQGSIHTVCITNNHLPPTNYYLAFIKGDTSFLEATDTSPITGLPRNWEFKEEEGYDCADKTKYNSEYLKTEIKTKTMFQKTYLLELHYLYAYKTHNTNLGEFFSNVWDTLKEWFGGKLDMGDALHQEDFVKMLLFPDKYKASKNLAIVNYYTIQYKKGKYTIKVHVYTYTNYPLDKAREMAKDTCMKLNPDNPEKCGE